MHIKWLANVDKMINCVRDAENLPSPIALGKTFMTLGEPPNRSTAYPDHAVSAASAYLGVSRPRIDSAQTIVNRETSTSQQMHRY